MRLHKTKCLIVGGAVLAPLFSAGTVGAQAKAVNSGKVRAGAIGVSTSPTLVIGGNEADESTTFGSIVGATRLPDGRILVGDRGDYNLRVFSANGKPLKHLGRKGSGPGEMTYLADLYRCGDSIFAYDIENGYRMSVFSLDLAYQREFRFAAPGVGGPPYKSSCNASQKFLQYGWEDRKQMKGGVFRTNVPFWFVDATQKPGTKFGEFPGSERWGIVDDGQIRGTRPLPFGKEAIVTIGAQHGYVGTGETYEIMVFDFAGKRVGTIRDATQPTPVTAADITLEIELQTANKDEETRKRVTAGYAAMKLPSTMPAYSAFKVDAMDLLWVRDYPRAATKTVRWSVFTPDGTVVGRVTLPSTLDVFEIGRDYILGRFMDAEVAIPQVHLYQLTR
ncbi:MAG: 6-bladed beta-propeller [Gemmatimonadaceae bacterium]